MTNLYPRSKEPFNLPLFKDPPAEYRGAPLWSWNKRLQRDQLLRQIDNFAKMGMGGYHIHSRIGLDTPYLGPEFMSLVTECLDYGKKLGLMTYLYDKDRWPSGSNGGMVAAKADWKCQHLLFTPWSYGDKSRPYQAPERSRASSASPIRSEEGFEVARFDVMIGRDGTLQSYRRLNIDKDEIGLNTWYAYCEPNPPSEWFNGNTYVDTLNADPIKKFIKTTYEPYKEAVGHEFGKSVKSMFTDEPQMAHKARIRRAHVKRDVFMPWTFDLAQTFKTIHGYDIVDYIPELFWNLPSDQPPTARYHFVDHTTERFVSAFTDTCFTWCEANQIALTGHVMCEPTLTEQTLAVGEAMRTYRSFHLPGIDLLCDRKEFTSAKQAQSVARQYGRPGIMSELYGVTNWTWTFEGHKESGDWQAALGVVFRVHHLTWVSMLGEGKRDYPACIGYQSPWYEEYKQIEDYFSRLNTVLSRGKPVCKIAVIHPVESFWLHFGPVDTSSEGQQIDTNFQTLTNYLIHNLVDFDFISESLLVELSSNSGATQANEPLLQVGEGQYSVVILPDLKTIRASTLDALRKFQIKGGTVIVIGKTPKYVDGKHPATDIKLLDTLFNGNLAQRIGFNNHEICEALEPYRDVKVTLDDGTPPPEMLYQMRSDGDDRWVFLCNRSRRNGFNSSITFEGKWSVTVFDCFTGITWTLQADYIREDTATIINWHFYGTGSLLVRLGKAIPQTPEAQLQEGIDWVELARLSDVRSVELDEPNVLMLDTAQWKLNNQAWQPSTEVLRIDNEVRGKLGMHKKTDALAQPWTTKKAESKDVLSVKFLFSTGIESVSPLLALENAETTRILVNGQKVENKIQGWWVDEDIDTVPLPSIKAGQNHELVLEVDFNVHTNVERVYLLGDFGVQLRASQGTIVPLDKSSLSVGNYTNQCLPFYAGNVDYYFDLELGHEETDNGRRTFGIEVMHFSAPLLAVELNGNRVGTIFSDPFIANLGKLEPVKRHKLRITSYGNRQNAFGAIHVPPGRCDYFGPLAWRTGGKDWVDELNLEPMGILYAPRLLYLP